MSRLPGNQGGSVVDFFYADSIYWWPNERRAFYGPGKDAALEVPWDQAVAESPFMQRYIAWIKAKEAK